MQWYDVVLKVLGFLSPVFTFLIGWIASKYKEEKKKREDKTNKEKAEYETMKETCKLTLRRSLKDDYEFFVLKQGHCSIENKNDVQNEYTLYHEKFKGNGRGTLYYDAIMALPNEKQEKKKDNIEK